MDDPAGGLAESRSVLSVKSGTSHAPTYQSGRSRVSRARSHHHSSVRSGSAGDNASVCSNGSANTATTIIGEAAKAYDMGDVAPPLFSSNALFDHYRECLENMETERQNFAEYIKMVQIKFEEKYAARWQLSCSSKEVRVYERG